MEKSIGAAGSKAGHGAACAAEGSQIVSKILRLASGSSQRSTGTPEAPLTSGDTYNLELDGLAVELNGADFLWGEKKETVAAKASSRMYRASGSVSETVDFHGATTSSPPRPPTGPRSAAGYCRPASQRTTIAANVRSPRRWWRCSSPCRCRPRNGGAGTTCPHPSRRSARA